MQPPYADTTPEAMRVWLENLRKMTPGEKLATVFELIRFSREMAAAGVRSRHPAADEREVFLRVAAPFKRILGVLDRLEIPYFVTGSVASSIYGIARTTLALDLVADLREDHIPQLASELHGDFYAVRK